MVSAESLPYCSLSAVVFFELQESKPLILHVHQVQPARRGRRSSCRTVARLKNPRQVLNGQRSLPYENERSHQISHHVVQKSRPPHGVHELVLLPLPCGRKNPPHV